LLSLFYPAIGVLAGYLGSVSALFCIYVLPTITYMKHKQTELENPLLAKALLENKFSIKTDNNTGRETVTSIKSPKIVVRELEKSVVRTKDKN
jgi:hypothetical protein